MATPRRPREAWGEQWLAAHDPDWENTADTSDKRGNGRTHRRRARQLANMPAEELDEVGLGAQVGAAPPTVTALPPPTRRSARRLAALSLEHLQRLREARRDARREQLDARDGDGRVSLLWNLVSSSIPIDARVVSNPPIGRARLPRGRSILRRWQEQAAARDAVLWADGQLDRLAREVKRIRKRRGSVAGSECVAALLGRPGPTWPHEHGPDPVNDRGVLPHSMMVNMQRAVDIGDDLGPLVETARAWLAWRHPHAGLRRRGLPDRLRGAFTRLGMSDSDIEVYEKSRTTRRAGNGDPIRRLVIADLKCYGATDADIEELARRYPEIAALVGLGKHPEIDVVPAQATEINHPGGPG
jgi:hypothetical protein